LAPTRGRVRGAAERCCRRPLHMLHVHDHGEDPAPGAANGA